MFLFSSFRIRRDFEKYGKAWEPNQNTIICGAHFVSHKFSKETNHPDYCPSIFPVEYKTRPKTIQDVARHDRVCLLYLFNTNRDKVT